MKLWTKIFIAILVLFLAGMAALSILLNRMKPELTERAQKALKEKCPTCALEFDGLSFTWRGLQAADIKFSAGRKGGQRVESRIRAVAVKLEWLALLRKDIRIDRVTLIEPDVTFFDGENRVPSKKKAASEDSDGFELELNKIVIQNAAFRYVRDVKGTHAELPIRDIDVTLTVEGKDTKDITEAKRTQVAAHITGQIGESGRVDIKTTASIKKGPLYIDTDVAVEKQNLEDLSRFFEPNAGVELHGVLTKGTGRIEVRGNKATAKLKAEYKDFKLKVHEMYDRDGFQAFFTNLGTAIAMKKENADLPPEKKRETANITREEGESIVSFMLRGLKEAAIDVTL